MREAKHAAFTGKAGEHAVASQLFLREMGVLWPLVDTGYDLMTEFGCRVQVKCAHFYHHKTSPRYFFPLPKTRRMPNTDKTTKLVARKSFAEVCDFVVFWGIEQNRFWIVPAALVDESTGVELGLENSQRRFVGSVSDMREMLKLGYNRGQVAKHYNIERQSLQQFLDSGKDVIDETVVARMRTCEGRWESILDFRNPAFVHESPISSETVGGAEGQAEGSKE
jgi:hypothetical protein